MKGRQRHGRHGVHAGYSPASPDIRPLFTRHDLIWSEMYLTDNDGTAHWIPVHTACYFWFGWTDAHELVIQKGDRLHLPERGNRFFRLQEDWMQWGGHRPAAWPRRAWRAAAAFRGPWWGAGVPKSVIGVSVAWLRAVVTRVGRRLLCCDHWNLAPPCLPVPNTPILSRRVALEEVAMRVRSWPWFVLSISISLLASSLPAGGLHAAPLESAAIKSTAVVSLDGSAWLLAPIRRTSDVIKSGGRNLLRRPRLRECRASSRRHFLCIMAWPGIGAT